MANRIVPEPLPPKPEEEEPAEPSPQQREKRFTPSLYTKRMDPSKVVADFIKQTMDESDKSFRTVAVREGLSYGPNPRPSNVIHFFGDPVLPLSAPVLVFFSGGYWQECSARDSAFFIEPFVDRNIRVAVVDYSRAPLVNIDEIVAEAEEAVKVILTHLQMRGQGPKRLYLAGHSAGAQLCAMVLASDWFTLLDDAEKSLFGGVFHLCGVFDLRPLKGTSLISELGLTLDQAKRNSPLEEKNVSTVAANCGKMKGFCTWFFCAQDDAPGLFDQQRDYKRALEEKGAGEVNLDVIMDSDHFDLVLNMKDKDWAVTEAICRQINKKEYNRPRMGDNQDGADKVDVGALLKQNKAWNK